jgi:hypothetical protein
MVKSRVFPGMTYLTKKPIVVRNKRQKKVIASPIGVTNLIVGVFRKKYKSGRSFVVEYTSQFGEHKKITLAQLKKLGVVSNTVIDNTFFQKTGKIEQYFSDDSFQYLCHTIDNPSYTPKEIIGMLDDYIEEYGFDTEKNKKYFKILLDYCVVIRPDLIKDHNSISCINKILMKYKAKNNELIPTKVNSKSMSNKKHRTSYGQLKSLILQLAVDFDLKKLKTPSKEEVLTIIRFLKNFHEIDTTEASVRKTLQRGDYSDSSSRKKTK